MDIVFILLMCSIAISLGFIGFMSWLNYKENKEFHENIERLNDIIARNKKYVLGKQYTEEELFGKEG